MILGTYANHPAYIHECTASEISILLGSRDLWSLGRLMLDMIEPWNTVLPNFQVGDTLKFSSPKEWSLSASDFLRNTSTALAKDLLQVG
jgi:hypothetical protein